MFSPLACANLSVLILHTLQVTFYYHIGQVGGDLQVLVKSEPSGEQRQIWIHTGLNNEPLTKPWIKTSVTFRQSQEFQVCVRV